MFKRLMDFEEGMFFLPIYSVQAVKVTCQLTRTSVFQGNASMPQPIALRVQLDSVWNEDDILYQEIVRDQEGLDKFLNTTLPSLKFNKMSNQFQEGDDDKRTSLELEIAQSIPKCDSIKWGFDECCVCMELTTTKTSCGHYLCSPCESALKTSKCPICRQCYSCGEHPDYREEY